MVGLATVDLRLPYSASLKDKRRVVRSITSRVRRKFNVAIAEVDQLDDRARITLAIASVSNDASHAHGSLERVMRFIERERLDAVIEHYGIELL